MMKSFAIIAVRRGAALFRFILRQGMLAPDRPRPSLEVLHLATALAATAGGRVLLGRVTKCSVDDVGVTVSDLLAGIRAGAGG
jgi:hypothetical protein